MQKHFSHRALCLISCGRKDPPYGIVLTHEIGLPTARKTASGFAHHCHARVEHAWTFWNRPYQSVP